MKKLGGVATVLGLAWGAALLTSGCAAASADGGDEATAQSNDSLAQAPRKGSVRVACSAWNSSCRTALNQKLVAARAKDPASVLRAMDTFAQSPQFISEMADEGPEPVHFCGGIGIVGICCDAVNGSGTFTCDFSFYLGIDFSVNNPNGSGSNTGNVDSKK